MGISDRFREERERLSLSQRQVAELLGVSLNAVNNWERGVSSVSADAVSRFGYTGADVLYILTGERASRPVLTAEEASLLDNYHHADEKGKAAARAVLEAVSSQKQKAA
jgi:transcriptional regulator with XRE-family HTH domain